MFTFVSKKKGLLFKVENDEKMPRFLYGDDIKLRQVLINVLGNAVKYTSKGFISLHITTSLENKKIWFEIQDSGFGVRKEDIPVLFSAFEQVKDQKNRNIVGTGLGLPISKAFVEMMGGTITLESDYGMGSVFNIIIPIEEGDESKVSSDSGSFKAQALSAPEAKVLVVDDNEFNLKVAVGLLELFDINADTAISGEESLDMIVDTDYDIVFMDHMMPDMDGLEATAQIRKLLEEKKETRRLPIIALTANAVQGSREMFLEHDMDDFLSKPIEMPILARILSEWLPPEKITIKHDVDVPDNKTENAKSADTDDIWEKINTISEIDAETGLRRLSGRKDMYQNNLKLFQERIDAHNEKMAALLSSGDIKNFSITVHAIKSALASIGAEQLSSIAFNLESASKGDDAEYCKQHFPLFSQRIAVLSKALKKALNPGGEAAEGKKSFASEADAAAFLKEKVQLTLEAIDDFDSDAGLAALDDALACKYDDKTTKLLESAAAELKRFKYNEAKDILEKLG
jgi:CheY-like chemotaxis protein/HPt (histidine-containing phosphotransfer) domain-containing protein/anti-sigma regulatory factor (Ser/Thr protein kinase)